MSSADIREVFELPQQGAGGAGGTGKKARVSGAGPGSAPRLDGLSRELYSLLGDNAPPLAVLQNRYKEKPKLRQRAKQWVWHGFENGARTDHLRLHHWVLKSDIQDGEGYRFEKFNKSVDVWEYSQEEFDDHLQDDEWTKEETDYLFDLCREYDLRFIVIADRYNYKGKERSIEDIKDRYYTVCRKLLLARNASGLSSSQEELLKQMMFDKDREMQRKDIIEKLSKRSPEELKEEENLIMEARRIEANEKKLQHERKELLRLLEEAESKPVDGKGNDLAQLTSSQSLSALASNMQHADKLKKRREPLTPAAIPSDIKLDSAGPKVKRLSPREEHMYGISWHSKLPSSAFIRSQKIPPVKSSLTQKVLAALQELGIPSRLYMPTARNCKKIEEIQEAIVLMLSAKAVVDKHEAEAQMNNPSVKKDDQPSTQSPVNPEMDLERGEKRKSFEEAAGVSEKRQRIRVATDDDEE